MNRPCTHQPASVAGRRHPAGYARRGEARALVHRLSAHMALLWLVLALAWVPTMGRLHQVAHAGQLAQVHSGQVSTAGLAASTPSGGSHSHALALLGGFLANHSLVDCLLLDQLALGDALHGSAPVLLPQVPALAPAALHATGVGARHVALFQARGPPAVQG